MKLATKAIDGLEARAGGLLGLLGRLALAMCVAFAASCSMHAAEPPEQAAFVAQWKRLLDERSAAAEAGNELKVRQVNQRIDAFFAIVPNVKGWTAEVESVSKTLFSGTFVTARHQGIEYQLTADEQDTALMNALVALVKSDAVVFSGRYEGETSWTAFGQITTPHVRVRLSAIARRGG